MSNRAAKIWTPEERARVAYLLSKKCSLSEIADDLRVTFYMARHEIMKGGGSRDYSPAIAERASAGTSNQKRSFSDEEGALVRRWLKEGRGIGWIRLQLRCGNQRLNAYILENDLELKRGSITRLLARITSLEEHIKLIYSILEERGNTKN